MSLQKVRDALTALGLPVGHFEASVKTPPYLVWAEDGAGESLKADGDTAAQALQGTIDYFTATEFDATPGRIQKALDRADIPWRLNSIQRETDTGFIHYEWVFEVENG